MWTGSFYMPRPITHPQFSTLAFLTVVEEQRTAVYNCAERTKDCNKHVVLMNSKTQQRDNLVTTLRDHGPS